MDSVAQVHRAGRPLISFIIPATISVQKKEKIEPQQIFNADKQYDNERSLMDQNNVTSLVVIL